MFWFKLWHKINNYFQPRKPKFKSDKEEMNWLIEQATDDIGCSERKLTPEQLARWHELTDEPFPGFGVAII